MSNYLILSNKLMPKVVQFFSLCKFKTWRMRNFLVLDSLYTMKRDNGLNVVNHPVLTRAIIRKVHVLSFNVRTYIHMYLNSISRCNIDTLKRSKIYHALIRHHFWLTSTACCSHSITDLSCPATLMTH